MKIRKAEERDIAGILKLLTQVNMIHHEGRPDLFNGPLQKYTGEELREILRDENRPVYVAAGDEADEVLGYVFGIFEETKGDNIRVDMKSFYIDDLCVDERSRGSHIGEQLLNFAENLAKENGCYNITLHVWSCNDGAARFYEKCGMKPQFVSMEKILAAKQTEGLCTGEAVEQGV